jgi:L-ascorbate metabolism protein UlaG (beta-lactamase superfamily)
MGPRDAALACQWLGVSRAIPIHYAHNAAVRGPANGQDFANALGEISPGTAVDVLMPGQTAML